MFDFRFCSPPGPDHDWLVDVLCKVSSRFQRLATDRSLWETYVEIHADKNPEKAEFVVQKCLNNDTGYFIIFGDLTDFFPVMNSPRYAEFINPTTRFHNLQPDVRDDYVVWSDVRHDADASIRATACKCDECRAK